MKLLFKEVTDTRRKQRHALGDGGLRTVAVCTTICDTAAARMSSVDVGAWGGDPHSAVLVRGDGGRAVGVLEAVEAPAEGQVGVQDHCLAGAVLQVPVPHRDRQQRGVAQPIALQVRAEVRALAGQHG